LCPKRTAVSGLINRNYEPWPDVVKESLSRLSQLPTAVAVGRHKLSADSVLTHPSNSACKEVDLSSGDDTFSVSNLRGELEFAGNGVDDVARRRRTSECANGLHDWQ